MCNVLGEFVCINSVTRLIDRQLLVISLAEQIVAGSAVLLRIRRFSTYMVDNPALIHQVPSSWEKDRAWSLSSFFPIEGTRTVFPSVDLPTSKASFQLCIVHPERLHARLVVVDHISLYFYFYLEAICHQFFHR